MTQTDRIRQARALAEDSDELERYDLEDDDGETEDESTGSVYARLLGY